MLTRIRLWLAPPVFENDEEKTRIASVLNAILLVYLVIALLSALFALPASDIGFLVGTLSILVMAGLTFGPLFLMRRGRVRLAAGIFVSTMWILCTGVIFVSGGVFSPMTAGYIVVAIMAALLLGGGAAFTVSGLSIVVSIVAFYLESNGSMPPTLAPASPIFGVSIVIGSIIPATALVYLATRSIQDALAQARSNERTLVERAQEIAVFRALAENAADAILMSTLEGEITYANRAGYEIFGYDHEELEMVGMTTSELVPREEAERANRQTISTTLRKGSWRGEMKYQRKDGSTFDADSAVFVIQDESGGQAALASIIRDITEQKQAEVERERLQQEVIEAQRQTLLELSSPVIPVMDAPDGSGGIIVMPIIGSIDSARARDITRSLLAGIREHKAKVAILDITGMPVVDSGVASHLNRTIQAARLKGARTIITGISEAVAETIVDLGIDWSTTDTLSDLQTGLVVALDSLGFKLKK